jgi:integrase
MMKLIDFYEQTFRRLRLKGRSIATDRQYRVQLRHFDRFLERPATLADLDDDVVSAFLADRADKVSQETANKARNHLLALWRFAARKRHVDQFPDVESFKERKRIPQAWSHAQLAKLVETAYRGDHLKKERFKLPSGEIPLNLWWTALILVLYETGIRIGAALKLRTTDIDLENGRLFVRAEIQKQFADQAFTLTPQTTAILRQFAKVERDLLFPWGLCPSTFYHHWRKLLLAAGLPTGRHCGPHRIRRTTATMAELHIGRGTATGILGHSSAHVTRAYIDSTKLPDTRVGEQLPRALLVGEFAADGSVPTEKELLPTPPPAPVPIDHHVLAVILQATAQRPDEHPLLDADIFSLSAEFQEKHLRPLSDRYRYRSVRYIRETLHGCRCTRPADIDGQAMLVYLRERRERGDLSRYTYQLAKAAIGSFLRWLVTVKGIYALARHVAPFDAHWHHGERGAVPA